MVAAGAAVAGWAWFEAGWLRKRVLEVELDVPAELDGIRIALLHSHDRRLFRQTVDSGLYRLVCYGHSHVAAIDQRGDTVVLNPGAIYRANPHSIAIADLPHIHATIINL